MVEKILDEAFKRLDEKESERIALGSTIGVFLSQPVLQSIELISEPPERQIAWIRIQVYLISQGLPLRGNRLPKNDRFWGTVCGMTYEEMMQPNGLWSFSRDGTLQLHLDLLEVQT